MPTSQDRPVRVTILNDHEIIVSGVASLLAPYADRVTVVERVSQLPPRAQADVVLHDTFSQAQGNALDLSHVRGDSGARVVVFSWSTDAGLVSRALAAGAHGYVAKSATAEELVEAIERVHAGEVVRPHRVESPTDLEIVRATPDWPGKAEGLTARESEVVALITMGLSNQEIAERCFLSINSIKTYIRTAYRKMGTSRRADAVRWGIEHGFRPDAVRHLDNA